MKQKLCVTHTHRQPSGIFTHVRVLHGPEARTFKRILEALSTVMSAAAFMTTNSKFVHVSLGKPSVTFVCGRIRALPSICPRTRVRTHGSVRGDLPWVDTRSRRENP